MELFKYLLDRGIAENVKVKKGRLEWYVYDHCQRVFVEVRCRYFYLKSHSCRCTIYFGKISACNPAQYC